MTDYVPAPGADWERQDPADPAGIQATTDRHWTMSVTKE